MTTMTPISHIYAVTPVVDQASTAVSFWFGGGSGLLPLASAEALARRCAG
jgi:hypothetical protein